MAIRIKRELKKADNVGTRSVHHDGKVDKY